jgi:hypothetical protein
MLPERLRRGVRAVPERIWASSEAELNVLIFGRDQHGNPNPVRALENRLRISFWKEYDRAIMYGATNPATGKEHSRNAMKITNIIRGVCSEHFLLNCFNDHFRTAWILRPPIEYMIAAEDLLELANARTREVLELPLRNSKGQPNVKLAEVISRIRHELEMRVRGAVAQRHRNENVNINVDVNGNPLPKGSPQLPAGRRARTPEELDQRIKELNQEMARIGLPPAQTQITLVEANKVPEGEVKTKLVPAGGGDYIEVPYREGEEGE